MWLKGIVSTVDNVNRKARVSFPERDNATSYELPIAQHVGELSVNNVVAAIICTDNFSDGIIIAKI